MINRFVRSEVAPRPSARGEEFDLALRLPKKKGLTSIIKKKAIWTKFVVVGEIPVFMQLYIDPYLWLDGLGLRVHEAGRRLEHDDGDDETRRPGCHPAR